MFDQPVAPWGICCGGYVLNTVRRAKGFYITIIEVGTPSAMKEEGIVKSRKIFCSELTVDFVVPADFRIVPHTNPE
jgi:hypothetical protein